MLCWLWRRGHAMDGNTFVETGKRTPLFSLQLVVWKWNWTRMPWQNHSHTRGWRHWQLSYSHVTPHNVVTALSSPQSAPHVMAAEMLHSAVHQLSASACRKAIVLLLCTSLNCYNLHYQRSLLNHSLRSCDVRHDVFLEVLRSQSFFWKGFGKYYIFKLAYCGIFWSWCSRDHG